MMFQGGGNSNRIVTGYANVSTQSVADRRTEMGFSAGQTARNSVKNVQRKPQSIFE